MRSESEIMNMIIKTAVADNSVRAVLLNGSRVSSKVKKDRYQDFDVVFMVHDINSFIDDPRWIDIFGEILIMQTPDVMLLGKKDLNKRISFTYLMLFKDGNRIDLTLFPADKIKTDYQVDSLTGVLLDKDGLFTDMPPANDRGYLIKKPSAKEFSDHCNEFWWVSTYVSKGLARKEITYAKAMMDGPVRKMFMKMLEWYIGIKTNFLVSFGKDGRFIKDCVSGELYRQILKTYSDAEIGNMWNSLLLMTDLFKKFSGKVKTEFDFQNESEGDEVIAYLKKIRKESEK
jgi:aminoglycoside 6-adenylyltransferase